MELTNGLGADAAFEAVGVPETFELCAELIALGDAMAAYDTFADAAHTNALKVVLRGANGRSSAIASTDARVTA